MKKNRPGTQIQVLCDPDRRDEFVELLLRHSSTFGLKILEVDRLCLARRKETIATPLGPLDIKIGLWEGKTLKATAEYESCRRLAEASGLALSEVYARAQTAILQYSDSIEE
jgi:pyridinium-3,5-bisthiocarboxylic acid mononucleotide nickel chelatase